MGFDLILTRENLLTRSEEFDHADWTHITSPIITPDQVIAPDGTLTGTKLEEDEVVSTEGILNSVTTPDVTSYFTSSLFVLKDSTPRTTRFMLLRVAFTGSTLEQNDIKFDTQTGEHNLGTEGGDLDDVTGGVEDFNTEWWRIWVSAKSVDQSNSTVDHKIFPSRGASATWLHDVTVTGSIFMWGAQITAGTGLRPYSKTEGSELAGPYDGLEVFPSFDYKQRGKKFESRHRVRSGDEFAYKWGEYNEKRFGVTFVNSEFKSVVNSYWNSNTALEFQEDFEVSSVHLINKTKPIDQLQKPYDNLFKGKIQLGTY